MHEDHYHPQITCFTATAQPPHSANMRPMDDSAQEMGPALFLHQVCVFIGVKHCLHAWDKVLLCNRKHVAAKFWYFGIRMTVEHTHLRALPIYCVFYMLRCFLTSIQGRVLYKMGNQKDIAENMRLETVCMKSNWYMWTFYSWFKVFRGDHEWININNLVQEMKDSWKYSFRPQINRSNQVKIKSS